MTTKSIIEIMNEILANERYTLVTSGYFMGSLDVVLLTLSMIVLLDKDLNSIFLDERVSFDSLVQFPVCFEEKYVIININIQIHFPIVNFER